MNEIIKRINVANTISMRQRDQFRQTTDIHKPGNLFGFVSDILCERLELAVDPLVSFLFGGKLTGPPLLGVKLLPLLLTKGQVLRSAIFLPLVIVVLREGRGEMTFIVK